LTVSAKVPAGRVKMNNGSDATVDRSERKKVEELSMFIIQAAAVSWAATKVHGRASWGGDGAGVPIAFRYSRLLATGIFKIDALCPEQTRHIQMEL
jgi:hypothetical protein